MTRILEDGSGKSQLVGGRDRPIPRSNLSKNDRHGVSRDEAQAARLDTGRINAGVSQLGPEHPSSSGRWRGQAWATRSSWSQESFLQSERGFYTL